MPKYKIIDIFICINNIDKKKCLTLNKPYKVLQMCRQYDYNIWYLIKNDTGQEVWYDSERFKPRQ